MNNQMNNAVRKIHNLHSSGAVTVTGLSQPRILKQKVGTTVVTPANSLQHVNSSNRCYVCDDALGANQQQNLLTETQTSHTATKFPNKIGQLVGDAFMVIVSVEDVVCARCTNLLNYLDRLESDVERVRTNLMNLLHKKYGLNDDGGGGAVSPPIKMQKLNSGTATRTVEDSSDLNRVRKIIHTSAGGDSTVSKQSPPVSAVQQMKISTQVGQNSAGTQTIHRKTAKIYKCLSCDYKTNDMRLFNTHYETCKQQNFQCKNCKKIFPNFGSMKQHMVREHNTTMDNTCAVCHINLVNEAALRKHMEANHSTNVVVTSTSTLQGQPTVDSITTGSAGTPLYTCNHCQFKSTDKALFDEHFRKHLSGVKPKPFKCRLCAQRFETREAATVHAKQHQPNYFKCGTCSMSFPKRELLVKHFEVHQQQQQQQSHPTTTVAVTTVQQHQQVVAQPVATVKQIPTKQQVSSQNLLTTQKLLQETIDEALSDNVNTGSTTSTADVSTAAANNIRFFSCQICSLTFIQENYFNQHMEAHRRDKEADSGSGGTSVVASTVAPAVGNTTLTTLNPNAAALLNESTKSDNEAGTSGGGAATQQSHTAGIFEADIESIFEKMHSDKSDAGTAGTEAISTSGSNTGTTNTASSASGGTQSGDNLVITSQEGSGGITFNITIPQPDSANAEESNEDAKSTPTSNAPVSVSIDMPMLDQPEEGTAAKSNHKDGKPVEETASSGSSEVKATTATPVSMPSLDDDNDAQEQTSHTTKTEESSEGKKEIEGSEGEGGAKAEDKNKEQQKDGNAELTAAEGDTNTNVNEATDANDREQPEATHSGEAEGTLTAEQLGNAAGEHQQVAMELDEAMQAQVESGQIKFILNENGLLQLDNHILTDAEGNQILVQDPEQIQQLLQSVGVLQSGDGLDGETLQMMTDANGQMVLVHGENNETQLIDASLLNADGQLVIQQGQDGELGEGAHVIGEDGTRIPVSVSYTPDGQPLLRVQQQVLEAGEGTQHVVLEKDTAVAGEGASQTTAEAATGATGGTAVSGGDGSGGGDFFALEDLMQQSSENKAAE